MDLIPEIVNAAHVVHSTLGPGFIESIYGRALVTELRARGQSIERERLVKIWYGSQLVGKHRLDLVVGMSVIVELKATKGLSRIHLEQLRSYLHATQYPHGLVLNFGRRELEWEAIDRAGDLSA